MGSTYRFIADPSEQSEMLEWFCSIREPPTEKLSDCGVVLSFVAHGPRSYSSNGRIDSHSSPVVTVFLPRVRRGSDLDSREVHFLARPDSSFRPRRFAARLSSGVGLNVCFGSKVAKYQQPLLRRCAAVRLWLDDGKHLALPLALPRQRAPASRNQARGTRCPRTDIANL